MSNPETRPEQLIVSEALAELEGIVARVQSSGDIELMMADLERWKRRTTDELRGFVSEREAGDFARLALRPSWVNMESIDGPLGRHRAFLASLLRELERRPVRRPIVQAAVESKSMSPPLSNPVPPTPSTLPSLTKPELAKPEIRSLNAWLERETRVRGRVWIVMTTFAALVLAALALL